MGRQRGKCKEEGDNNWKQKREKSKTGREKECFALV